MKIRDLKFIVGLIITVIGFLASLTFFWIIFGLPLYLLGIIVTMFSKKARKFKLLYASLLVLFWWPGVWVFYSIITPRAPSITFLIPQNFRGKITLYYNESCGLNPVKRDNRLIYQVPDNGILILKDRMVDGIVDNEYLLVDSRKREILQLPELIQQDYNESYTLEKNKHEPSRNRLGVFLGGTGTGAIENDRKRFQAQTLFVGSWNRYRQQKEHLQTFLQIAF